MELDILIFDDVYDNDNIFICYMLLSYFIVRIKLYYVVLVVIGEENVREYIN